MDSEAEVKKQVKKPWRLVTLLKLSGTKDQVKTSVKLPGFMQTKPERYHRQTLEEQFNEARHLGSWSFHPLGG